MMIWHEVQIWDVTLWASAEFFHSLTLEFTKQPTEGVIFLFRATVPCIELSHSVLHVSVCMHRQTTSIRLSVRGAKWHNMDESHFPVENDSVTTLLPCHDLSLPALRQEHHSFQLNDNSRSREINSCIQGLRAFKTCTDTDFAYSQGSLQLQ